MLASYENMETIGRTMSALYEATSSASALAMAFSGLPAASVTVPAPTNRYEEAMVAATIGQLVRMFLRSVGFITSVTTARSTDEIVPVVRGNASGLIVAPWASASVKLVYAIIDVSTYSSKVSWM